MVSFEDFWPKRLEQRSFYCLLFGLQICRLTSWEVLLS